MNKYLSRIIFLLLLIFLFTSSARADFGIQIASFNNKIMAKRYAGALIEQNYKAFYSGPEDSGWYSVCVGPFPTWDEALKQKDVLRSKEFDDDIFIINIDSKNIAVAMSRDNGLETKEVPESEHLFFAPVEVVSEIYAEKAQTPVKVEHEPVNNISSPEKQLDFLIKRLFGIQDKEMYEFPAKGNALKYLKTYTGQGGYGINEKKLFPVDQAVAGIAKQNERKQILLAVRAELARRGYRRRDLKKVSIRGLGDGVRVNNVFYETDIREALNEISEQINIPIIIDDTVQGTVNIKFENTPMDEALKKLLLPGGFSFREIDGYYLVGFPHTSNPTFKHLSKTKLIRPVYMKPGEIAGLLSDDYKPFIKVNDNSNLIVITSPPGILRRICDDIAVIDSKPGQIMLKALIVDLTSSAKRTLGFDWWPSLEAGVRIGGEKLDLSASLESGFNFSLKHPADLLTNNFAANFHALVESGEAKVWATPRVVTVNGKKAVINISSEQIFSIVSGPENYLQVTTKEMTSGVILEITPRVSVNGEICLTIHKAEVGTISKSGETGATGKPLPVLTKRSVSTTVVVKNQETIVIGGLLEKQSDGAGKSIPGLDNIPGLNNTVFGMETKNRQERDLVIFITPIILNEHIPDMEKEDYL
jgi:Bacterial type II and III secretion system protein/SPOR domain